MKGRLDYDQKLAGYSWDASAAKGPEEGYRLDTSAFTALSNKGHDKDRIQGDRIWKLDWSDDKAGAMAIIEYLKTR
jgi:hypothetical protein